MTEAATTLSPAPRARVQAMKEYHPPLGCRDALRLDFNENTFACSPKVREALGRVSAGSLTRYPEREPIEAIIAAHLGVAAQQVALTNGVDEAIHVLFGAFLEAGDDALVVQTARASLIYPDKNGLVAAQGGAPVDPLMLGEALWHAAQISNDPELRKAADAMLDYTLHRAPRAGDGTIFHTKQTIWSDSFHTSPPFLAFAGNPTEAIRQIDGHWKRLWNPQRKLLAHIWNEERQAFEDPAAWGGGNGWAAAALRSPPSCAGWPTHRARTVAGTNSSTAKTPTSRRRRPQSTPTASRTA